MGGWYGWAGKAEDSLRRWVAGLAAARVKRKGKEERDPGERKDKERREKGEERRGKERVELTWFTWMNRRR